MSNDYTYCFPEDFKEKLVIYSEQRSKHISSSLKKCSFEYTDVGLAYNAGMKGDNWNKHAIDLEIRCPTIEMALLHRQEKLLKEIISISLDPNKTGLIIRNIYCLDIQAAESILVDVINIANQLCSNASNNIDSQENSLNDYLRDMLVSKGHYEIKDQTRHGISQSGRNAGEVDILITKNGQEKALIEGLKLGSVDTNYIDKHIEKVIGNYNPLGVATFVIAYVNTNDFSKFCEKYYKHISDYHFAEMSVVNSTELEVRTQMSANIKIAHRVISKDGYEIPLYFIVIKLSKGIK